MAYESPKQIRNRQQRAEAKAARPRRQNSRGVKVPTAERREEFFTFHSDEVARAIENGDEFKAGCHARTLIHGVMQFRALEMQHSFSRAYFKAAQMARAEIYGDLREGIAA